MIFRWHIKLMIDRGKSDLIWGIEFGNSN